MFIQSIIKIKFIKNKHERKQNKKKGANQNKAKIPPLTTKKKKKKIQENSRSKTNGGTFALSLIALKT